MGQLFEITPFSLLDYPGEMACIAWFAGCNMRCIYCHNPQIVQGKGEKEVQELLDFLERRTGRLSGVVFSGGEATLYRELPSLIQRVKAMGFKTKLDTNGSRPEVLREILAQGSVDYVAMDYKCPREMAQSLIGTAKLWEPFRQSLSMMIEEAAHTPSLTFEVRTTVFADKMSEQELNWIINDLDQLGYAGTYYIQNVFSFGEKTIGNIPEPECEINRGKLAKPKNFTLAFRNFKE
ncbi:MAG: anaerobic ribonucleoside-triphosphate reductase activating protein [Proteobacteria bacterium]|jgi:pyruvate formate lyase activating enzyme|nr:anaerobic ribonucleoside-triphosphate reductase activating protein [Alphaproteobacteria bacterium]NCC02599.1 anaerobic ribonucleoside-triphosphate reductase activating protein [Pseudomonadota bacterium]